jgi:hypothetical protein
VCDVAIICLTSGSGNGWWRARTAHLVWFLLLDPAGGSHKFHGLGPCDKKKWRNGLFSVIGNADQGRENKTYCRRLMIWDLIIQPFDLCFQLFKHQPSCRVVGKIKPRYTSSVASSSLLSSDYW